MTANVSSICFLGRRCRSGDSNRCTAMLMLIHGSPSALRCVPPSSSLSPNVGGVGSSGKLRSVFCGVCVAGQCGELLLAWVAWVGCECGMMVVGCGV